MSILLVGERYSANLGDAIICETVCRILKEHDLKANIIALDISGRIGYGAYYDVLKDFAKLKVKHYLRIPFQYSDCLSMGYCIHNLSLRDLLRYSRTLVQLEGILEKNNINSALYAGGQIFYDYFVDMLYCVTKRLSKAGIEVRFFGCGSGNTSSRTEKLLKETFALPNIDSISVRDSYSKISEFLDESVRIYETCDAAINCSRYYPASQNQSFDFGIGCFASENSIEDLLRIIEDVSRKGYTWKLFTNGNINDYKAAIGILTQLGLEEEMDDYLFERPIRPIELIQHITSCRHIISFRLHSLIVASSYGIPSAGIVWDDKIVSFYQKLGFEQRCYYSGGTDKIDYDDICDSRKKEILKKKVSEWMRDSTDMLLKQCGLIKE